MTTDKIIHPPHPIPYPDNWLIKQLYRTPILLYRLGLSNLIGKYILIISTFGRKTRKVRRTPIEYFRTQGRIYVISGFKRDPDWYKNIQADPHVTLQTDHGIHHVIARLPETDQEWQGVFEYLRNSPVSRFSMPGIIQQLDDPEVQQEIKIWPVITFDPTDEPCPTPLDIDLLWTWPLILLGLAIKITLGWLSSKSRK